MIMYIFNEGHLDVTWIEFDRRLLELILIKLLAKAIRVHKQVI